MLQVLRTGIFSVTGKDLLMEYANITDAEITAAAAARTDPQAKQNAQTMYRLSSRFYDWRL